MRFPNPFLASEVPTIDSSGGTDASADAASDTDVSGDVPALEEEGEGEAREDGRDAQGRFRPKAGDEAKPPPPAKRKFALKTKEGVVEEELTDEEVTQRLTRDRESYKRFEQAAADRKAAAAERAEAQKTRETLKGLLEDPRALRAYLREHAGEKAHDLMVHALREELQERSRDPKDVELERYRRAEAERVAAQEKEEAERGEQEAQAALSAEVERMRPAMEKAVWGALEKVGLPGDERLARVVAYHWSVNRAEGIELSMDELAKVASDELDRDLGVRTQGLTGSTIKQRYPHLYRAVHQDLLAQLKGNRGGNTVAPASAGADPLRTSASAPGAKKTLSPSEWRKL